MLNSKHEFEHVSFFSLLMFQHLLVVWNEPIIVRGSHQACCHSVIVTTQIYVNLRVMCRSLWPRGLRSGSAAARLLRLWVRILPKTWMSVCCKCCVLSGRGLCDELITRPGESYRLCCVVECDLETSAC
jgi:hypothetical protein